MISYILMTTFPTKKYANLITVRTNINKDFFNKVIANIIVNKMLNNNTIYSSYNQFNNMNDMKQFKILHKINNKWQVYNYSKTYLYNKYITNKNNIIS
jgi:hypothetical protein